MTSETEAGSVQQKLGLQDGHVSPKEGWGFGGTQRLPLTGIGTFTVSIDPLWGPGHKVPPPGRNLHQKVLAPCVTPEPLENLTSFATVINQSEIEDSDGH